MVDNLPESNHSIPTGVGWIEYSEKLEHDHGRTWQYRDENYWLKRLMQEVGELASALAGEHDDPPEWELMQIRAICGNWLAKRQRAAPTYPTRRPEGPTGRIEKQRTARESPYDLSAMSKVTKQARLEAMQEDRGE